MAVREKDGQLMTATARKTFSGYGRKPCISPPAREPNGRSQRLYGAEGKEIVETRDECLSTVLAQPHRRGFDDPGRHWAIGRLILDGIVVCPGISSGKMIHAAEDYDRAWAEMRWVLASRRPWANTTGIERKPPTEDERREAETKWGDIQLVLRDAGPVASKACERAILDRPEDERLIPWWFVASLPGALRALVKHFELDK